MTTDNKQSVMPCPFCGSSAFATYKTDDYDEVRKHSVHCHAQCGGKVHGQHYTEADAIAAWNSRATAPQANAEVRNQALEEAAKICVGRSNSLHDGGMHSAANEAAKCASAIRSRKLKSTPAEGDASEHSDIEDGDYQCSSCGGFCSREGCEREDVPGGSAKGAGDVTLPPLPEPTIEGSVRHPDLTHAKIAEMHIDRIRELEAQVTSVRNAALEEAALQCDQMAGLVGRSGGAGELARGIRALKSALVQQSQGEGDAKIEKQLKESLAYLETLANFGGTIQQARELAQKGVNKLTATDEE